MISHRLRSLRRSKGYTLDQLSEISGVNRGTIHRIELDQVSPRVDTLALLCQALGTDFQGFFRGVEVVPDPDQEDHGTLEPEPALVAGMGESEGILENHDFRHGLLDWLEHLEALIHCSADGFAVTDRDGFIIYESQVSILLRGSALQARRNRPWFACAHPEDRPSLSAGMQAVLEQPDEVLPLDYRVPTTPEGGWRWVRSTLRNQLKHPAIEGIVINTQDITAWKKAEEQRGAIQKFEAQLQVMRTMTAEFANLWMAVQGHIEVARMSGANPNQLKGIQQSLDRASALLNQMRDVCGHPSLDLKPVDLNGLVQEKVDGSGVSLALAAPLPLIQGDRELLGRLIQNLMELLKASLDGNVGTIRFATSRGAFDEAELARRFKDQGLEQGGAFVVLEVEGPAGPLDAIWNEHLLSGSMGLAAGPGLPLPAILRTVRDHRGVIEWEQGKGGNRIRIHFPAFEPQETAPAKAKAHAKAKTILVVDDEEFLLLATEQMLARVGYSVRTARGGREALEIQAKEGPSIGLILLDLNMPFMNGEETYRELRKVDPAVKVVLCTGSAASGHEPAWANAGLAGILRKPFSYQDLQKLVKETLPR